MKTKKDVGPWSICYVADGELYWIGPFETEIVAMKAASDANESGEFDIESQYVYLVSPKHEKCGLNLADLG